MNAAGEILLVACYEMGHQPLSLALPLAFLRRAGYQPAAVDTSVETLSDAAIERARLVAIAIPMHTATRLGARIADRVRRVNPRAHIVFCGLYAALNADLLIPARGDSVLGGEYEEALVALAQALERGEPIAAKSAPLLERLDFPVPERAALPPLTQYAHFRDGSRVVPAGYVEATRGCLHTCTHCPITPVYGGRFFVVPRDVVLADIRAQVAAGARHITFGDPDFLNAPRHSLELVRRLHAEFPDVTFDATVKVEHLLERAALLPELKSLGCAFIVSALESFNDPILAHLAKGHTAADIAAALRITREAGIVLRPTFVAFTPWTGIEEYLHMLAQVEEHGLVAQVDPVQYTIRLLIPPDSALLSEENRVAGWLGALDRAAFTYRWAHPDPRMDELQQNVAALVESAVARGDTPAAIFRAIGALAYRVAGRAQPAVAPDLLSLAPEVAPGLTESWFC